MRATSSVGENGLATLSSAPAAWPRTPSPSCPRLVEAVAGAAEAHQLGTVGDMVAGALDVLGHEQKMRAGGDGARILHHVGEQLAEQAGIDLVDLLVAFPAVARLGDVAVGEGV